MDIEIVGNRIEAGVWILVAIGLLVKGWRSANPLRRFYAILGVAFFVFGISDVIESFTGAWWRPWWLLAMKGTCIAVFVLGFGWYYFKGRRTAR